MYVVSESQLKLQKGVVICMHAHFISGVKLPDLDSEWHVTWADKQVCA